MQCAMISANPSPLRVQLHCYIKLFGCALRLVTNHKDLRAVLPKPNRIARADYATGMAVVILLACGNVVAAPFFSNQNQYLVHALFGMDASVTSDWFRNTVDPYPFFSAIAKLTYDWGGTSGIRILAFLGTVLALESVYMLSRLLTVQNAKSNAALLGTVAVGLTLLPHTPHAFEGVAGQYVISTPAYLQPSMFGCLVLFAVPCVLTAQKSEVKAARKLYLAIALVSAALGCAFHPIYAVCALMLLAAAFIANILQGANVNLRYFALAATVLVLIATAANPTVVSMAFPSSKYSLALERFAFERIPYHSQTIDWQLSDIIRLVIAMIATRIARTGLNERWLANFLGSALIMATTATLAVQLSGQSKLVLLFPWRVSVFIMPVSFTVIAVWVADNVEQALPRWNWRWLAMIAAIFMAVYGCVTTLLSESPATFDERTALVRAVRPSGVGLVPLSSDNVRLNAPANIYVDWKSPPYASEDLVEWWYRVDQLRQFERDVDRFCSTGWHAKIHWILLPAKQKPPSCVSKWRVAGRSANWRILEED